MSDTVTVQIYTGRGSESQTLLKQVVAVPCAVQLTRSVCDAILKEQEPERGND